MIDAINMQWPEDKSNLKLMATNAESMMQEVMIMKSLCHHAKSFWQHKQHCAQ